jgi:hypothetical protein
MKVRRGFILMRTILYKTPCRVKPDLSESMPPLCGHLSLSGILAYPAVLESLVPAVKNRFTTNHAQLDVEFASKPPKKEKRSP